MKKSSPPLSGITPLPYSGTVHYFIPGGGDWLRNELGGPEENQGGGGGGLPQHQVSDRHFTRTTF